MVDLKDTQAATPAVLGLRTGVEMQGIASSVNRLFYNYVVTVVYI